MLSSIISSFILLGCVKEIPKCADERTVLSLKETLISVLGIGKFKEKLLISGIRPTGLNKAIEKYSCEATVSNWAAENQQQFASLIKYDSQINDSGEHVVVISHLDNDLVYVATALMANAMAEQEASKKIFEANTRRPVKVEPANPVAVESPTLAAKPESKSLSQLDVCDGLDLTIHENQKQCMNLKFDLVDKNLNETYKKLYKSLAASDRVAFKREQIIWIGEKERKCAQAEEQFQGGTFGIVAGLGCSVQMTEDRLLYLKKYK